MNYSSGLYNVINQKEINESIERVLQSDIDFNTYVSPKGLKELRKTIATFLNQNEQMKVTDQEILITTGSQQSINLVVDTFLKENDKILVEEPTYYSALEVFSRKKLKVTGIPLMEEGLDLQVLEEKIKEQKPQLIYVVPTFNNPTGYTWSIEERKAFLKIINTYRLLVIEDDPYHYLNYTDQKYPTLYELNQGENVIYLGTFSKLISPSINVGYIVTHHAMEQLYQIKKSYDLCTSTFLQYVVLDYLNHNDLRALISKKIRIYRSLLEKSRNILKSSNQISKMTTPKGGLFYLVQFKTPIDLKKYENANIFYLDQNHAQEARINICSFLER